MIFLLCVLVDLKDTIKLLVRVTFLLKTFDSPVEEYNEFLDDTLLVIGEIERENMTLFLSQKGYFFGGYDDCLINWGNDFEKMLQNISDGNRGELKIID